jgi:hypothetical protein
VVVVDNSGFVVAEPRRGRARSYLDRVADSWHGKASPASVGIQGRVIAAKC